MLEKYILPQFFLDILLKIFAASKSALPFKNPISFEVDAARCIALLEALQCDIEVYSDILRMCVSMVSKLTEKQPEKPTD